MTALFSSKKKKTQRTQDSPSTTRVSFPTPQSATGGSISLLKQPWITERTMMLSELDQYVFSVDPRATKPQIKKQVEKMYNVDVVTVRSIRTRSSSGHLRGVAGRMRVQKKMIVTLKKGQKIDLTGNR